MHKRSTIGMICLGLSVALFIVVSAPKASAQLSDHVSITIRSKWVGLGKSRESMASAEQRSGRCFINGKLASTAVIDDLFRELAAAADKPALAALGINKSWLDQNAALAFAAHANDQPKVDREKFLTSFRTVSLIETLLPEVLRDGWTDDYPTVEVKISRNGKEITLLSKRQNVFMVPFDITENGTTRQSYNVKLVQAMVALMPANFTNLDRLNGKDLRSVVAEKVIYRLRSS